MSKVILTKQTREILKNFSTINSSILFRKGSTIKTISVGENAVAEYECEEDFPQTFGIYDLNQFMSGLSLFSDDPILEFDNESYLTIHGGGKAAAYTAKYFFSSPEITLKAAPEKDINFPDADMQFSITEEDLKSLTKGSLVYGLPDLSFISTSDGCIKLQLCDREDPTGNVYAQRIKGDTTGDYELYMKMDNVRLAPGNYFVKVSKSLITEWKHKELNLKYYIALEP